VSRTDDIVTAAGSTDRLATPPWSAAGAPSAGPPRFRPDIEGLRALAVLAVLGFHAGVPGMAGGFVGVDVFFVISGFLITGLLLAEARRTGTVRMGDFYARRARRILPAAGLTLAVTGVASALLLPSLRLLDVAKDVLASALYVANWRFIDGRVDYLAVGREHSPLLHFWSLAVEEQFYLLWPAMVLAAAVLARRTGWRLGRLVAGACAGLTVVSLVASLVLSHTAEAFAYMSSPTRAWQFGVGGLVAVGAARVWAVADTPAASRVLVLLGWLGLAMVLVGVVGFDDDTRYPGTAALLPTVGTALVVLAGLARRVPARTGSRWGGTTGPAAVGILFSHPVPRYLGRLSYAWYLWHWPVIALAGELYGPLSWPVKAALAAVSAVPAELSMRLVEARIRFSPRVAGSTRGSLGVGLVAMVVPLAVAAGVFGTTTVELANATAPRPSVAALQATMSAPDDGNLLGAGPVYPGPGAARYDRPAHDECLTDPDERTSLPCRFGASGSDRLVVLFGDSHAQQWFTPLAAIARERGMALRVLTKGACPPVDLRPLAHPLTKERPYRACEEWLTWALAEIERERPDVVVLGSLFRYSLLDERFEQAWDRVHARLAASGAELVYLRDTPYMGRDMPVCISGGVADWVYWSDCAVPRSQALPPDPLAVLVGGGGHPDVRLVDLTPQLCGGDRCPAVRDGVLLYRDTSHLTDTAARGLLPVLRRALGPVLNGDDG
jgi:peptidoglycan/LPS O-acetylase OafA/YrhL